MRMAASGPACQPELTGGQRVAGKRASPSQDIEERSIPCGELSLGFCFNVAYARFITDNDIGIGG
jgi:hypothetical protein